MKSVWVVEALQPSAALTALLPNHWLSLSSVCLLCQYLTKVLIIPSSLASTFQYTTIEMNIIVSFKLIEPLIMVGCQCCCPLLSSDGLFKNLAALFPTVCSFSYVSFSHRGSNSFVLLPPSFNLRVVLLFLGDSACCVHVRVPCACVLAAWGINPLFTGVRHESWEW